MKIPYRWIREFCDLDLSAEQAADRLLNAGVEVASVTPIAPDLRGVVVAEIQAIERELGESHGHQLVLCRVSTGREAFSVVCGAPNVVAGAHAAFAPPGTTLPGGRAITTVTVRGVPSQGMLCSERELGLGEEHEAGLLLLDAGATPGTDLVSHLGLDDHVLEIEITPNRPDCLSVVGIARELSALTGAPFRVPAVSVKESDPPVETLARVRIEDPDLCHRFTARVISGVRVGPSPVWLAMRLRAVGLRPISNVVDVTNYVMWELGHPLHAFDHRTVTDGTIIVRRARPGERMTTLDGQERALAPEVLVIADPRQAIGIAGVMGGAETEVTAGTQRVFLESAYFLPSSVRRTARDLGLKTEAAYRFERGADVEALVDASDRTAQLIAELAGGVVARGMVDAYPTRHTRPRVRLRMSRLKRVLGVAPSRTDAARILTGLGLTTQAGTEPDTLAIDVPSFRRDLAIEEDLVEEVIRVWGYDKILSTLPGGAIALVRQPPTALQEQAARAALAGAGLSEVVTYNFADPARTAALGGPGRAEPLALLNPLSREASVLRQHPLEGVLGVIATNVRRQQPTVRVFEITKTYEGTPHAPREPRWATIALTGLRAERAWHGSVESADVFDARGLAEHVLEALGVGPVTGAADVGMAGFEPDCHGILYAAGGTAVAEFGEVAATARAAFDIEVPVFAAVIALDAVASIKTAPLRYQPLPRFPHVARDVAFVLGDPALTAATVEEAIRAVAGPLLRDVTVFDVFRFPDGRRSLAWRLTFQADDRTLTDDEVNAIQARVVDHVTRRFDITLRS